MLLILFTHEKLKIDLEVPFSNGSVTHFPAIVCQREFSIGFLLFDIIEKKLFLQRLKYRGKIFQTKVCSIKKALKTNSGQA
jgi:hypothetical protein